MTSNIESIVRQLIEEGFNKGNMDVVNAITSPALVEHQNYVPNHAAGAEGVRAVVASLRHLNGPPLFVPSVTATAAVGAVY